MIKTKHENKKTILLTGGGTAGHILPNLALLPYLETSFNRIYYIGSTKESERKIVEDAGIQFFQIKSVKLYRGLGVKDIMNNLKIPFGFLKSKRQAAKLLAELTPDIVFSKGGFVALPVVRAAKSRRIPVIVHESDASLGLANRLSVDCCIKICTSFDLGKNNKKFINTGSLIRSQIYKGDREIVINRHHLWSAVNFIGTVPQRLNLLVLGGSLGAAKINSVIGSAIWELVKKYTVIHICGRDKTSDARHDQYIQIEYVEDIENYFAWADIVISRAGSNTMSELMVLGKSTLFIPLSTGRGDQLDNIAQIQRHNSGGVLLEKDLDKNMLLKKLDEVWADRDMYTENSKSVIKDGTKHVYDIICNTLGIQSVN